VASYTHWVEHYSSAPPKKVTWVCGEERVLVEEVVDHTRAALGVSDMDYVSIVAGSAPDKEIWAAANQYPFTPDQNRLVLVRDAERVKRWDPLEAWLANTRQLPTVHLLFVSSEHDFPYQTGKDGKSTGDLKRHVGWIKGKGHLVRCSYPNEEDVVAWVKRQVDSPVRVAEHLLRRVGGDLGLARNVCLKAQLFSGELSTPVVDVLCSESPSSDFVDALVRLQKPKAFRALEVLPQDAWSMTIGQLDYRLEILGKLHSALRKGQTIKDVSISGSVPVFLARELMPVAKIYDRDRRLSCRRVLAVADDALRGGARDGCMESLVALW
jgi:DNA polymerase III delta subunit